MMRKIIEYVTYVLIFLLPWQARLISAQGWVGEYSILSLYAWEILWLMVVVLALGFFWSKRQEITWQSPKQIFSWPNAWLIAMTGLAIWSFLSIFWALDTDIAWQKNTWLVEGLVLLALIIAFTRRYVVAIVLSLMTVLQSALALWQFFGQKVWASKWLGMASQTPDILGTSVIEVSDQRWLRAYGSLSHPNMLAAFLVVGVAAILYLLNIAQKVWQKIILIIALLLTVSGLVVSFSRAGWLAAIIIIIGYWWQNRRGRQTYIVLGFVAVCLAVLTWQQQPLIFNRLISQQRLEIKSYQERLAGYGESWQVIKFAPLLGVGNGNYSLAVYKNIDDTRPMYAYQPVHNVLALIWAELGAVGLLLAILLFVNLLYYSDNKFLIIAIAVMMMLDHFWWSMFSGGMLWWAIVAWTLKIKKQIVV